MQLAARKLILVVDDFPESVDGLFAALAAAGFETALALDGEDGVRAARERRPDVIVMDLAMPRLDGLEATRRLKADPGTRGIPVVIFTEHPGDELGVLARHAGCVGVLGKGSGPGPLVAEVARLCPAPAPAVPAE
jgi:CheY-like chemotaxis protein